jgi:hypothetical protein
MTSQNPTKSLTPVKDDAEQTATEQPEVKKELTDDEIAAVAGGYVIAGSNNPSGGSSGTSGSNNPKGTAHLF